MSNNTRKFALPALALSIGLLSSIITQSASAAEVVYRADGQKIALTQRDRDRDDGYNNSRRDDSYHNESHRDRNDRDGRWERRDHSRYHQQRVWVPGYYEAGLLGLVRRWVPGHWEYRY